MIKKHEDAGIKHLNDPDAFIECSNTMDDVYENINDYNPSRKKAIIKEFFIRCRNLNIALVCITHSYFTAPKDVRLNSTHFLIMKVNNRK